MKRVLNTIFTFLILMIMLGISITVQAQQTIPNLPSEDFEGENLSEAKILAGSDAYDLRSTETEPDEWPDTLDSYDGSYQEVIAELEEAGTIPSDGSLVLTEESAQIDGLWQLSQDTVASHILMSGEIYFTPGDESLELCALIGRSKPATDTKDFSYTSVGFDNDGKVFTLNSNGIEEDAWFNYFDEQIDLDEPHHLLFAAIENRLTIYVDGKLITDDMIMEQSITPGQHSIIVLGTGQCSVSNIWVYEVWPDGSPLCYISGTGVNLRSGPGTNYAVEGKLNIAEEADSSTEGADGYTWYHFPDGTWAREDVVDASSGCSALPVFDEDDEATTPDAECVIIGDGINKRGGPGTNYSIQGRLTDSIDADGQAQGAGGYIWWRLVDDTWVRSDVVSSEGNCDALPTVEAPPPPATGTTSGGDTSSSPPSDDSPPPAAPAGSHSSLLSAIRTARNNAAAIGGQIDAALGGSGTVSCNVIVNGYLAVIGAPTFNVSGQSANVQNAYNHYREGIRIFQNGVGSLYNFCIDPPDDGMIPPHTWAGARDAINNADSQFHQATTLLGG